MTADSDSRVNQANPHPGVDGLVLSAVNEWRIRQYHVLRVSDDH
jgi:hypothetical protein